MGTLSAVIGAIVSIIGEIIGSIVAVFVGRKLLPRNVDGPSQPQDGAESSSGITVLLKKDEAYIHPETNFIVVVTLVIQTLLDGGAYIRFTLPDGKSSSRKIQVGERIDFIYKGQAFFMAIAKMDPSNQTLTVQISKP
ncbi:MAG TPA: hypothetical protein VHG08_24705 [Longimicrobium sp.]|nr:hypothetical protein [Longimicrobium sp.]